MINSTYYKPRIFPLNGDGVDAEIDRAQSIDISTTLNREKVNEIGRDGVVGYIKKSPTVAYSLTQYEYGNLEFWQKLVNTSTLGNNGETEIALSDFKTSYFDICAYLTDDDGTFKGTVWYPGLRTSGFSISIGDPQDIVERSFELVGESAIQWQGDNKYLIYQKEDISSTTTDHVITLDKTCQVDPNTALKYMQRVLRVRGSTTTELSKSAGDYIEDATTCTIATVTNGDVIKLYYTSGTAPDTIFTLNDSDVEGIVGDSVSIYLYIPGSGKPSSSDYVYRLQSVTLDVSFDREDIREIGNKDVVARGIKSNTVTVTLGRILETFTIEEVLAGVAADFGKIDVEQLSDQASLIIKFYDDNTKTNFKYGMKAVGLSPTELRGAAAVEEYVTKENVLEGESLIISADTSVLGI